MIRIDALWLATAPLDMRAGPDKALGRVVEVFGAARLHHAYLFANQRGTRMKVLVHDGQGLWLLARRLHQGRFVWPHGDLSAHIELNQAQWQALIMGLPWPPMATSNSPTCGHPKFPQARRLDYEGSGVMARRAAASLSR